MTSTNKSLWPWIWTGLVGVFAFIGVVLLDDGDSLWWERVAIVALPTFLSFLGAIIAVRRRGNPIAWLLMFAGAAVLASGTLDWVYGNEAGPPAQPDFWDYLLIWISAAAGLLLIYSLVLVLYLFPNGRLLSKRWSWAIWLPAVFIPLTLFMAAFSETVGPFFADQGEVRWAVDNPIGFVPVPILDLAVTIWSVIMVIVLPIGGITSLIVRYRRSTVVVRTQIRWALYGSLLVGIFYPLGVWFLADSPFWSGISTLIALAALPIAITVAITRYRLFDIDRLISRTVSYGIVVALLGLVFAAGVVWIPASLGLADTPLVVAASTLAVAGLFNPIRRRVQAFIDRRFNRSAYEIEQVADEFADLVQQTMSEGELAESLLTTANMHFEPEASAVWIKDG